jgi:pimeloyl-ACP methyl ester carboxylesterase
MTTISSDCLFTKNGARLHCVFDNKMNDHSNLLLIPAPGLSSDSLTELATLLQTQAIRSIWMLDHPNDGNNVSENYNFANWQPALIEAITLLNHPIVIAHSTGGMFVQSIAELEELASGLILIGTAPNMDWKKTFDQYMLQNVTPEIENCANKYRSEPSDEALRDLIIASLKFSFMPESLIKASKMLQRLSINHTATDWSDINFDTTYKAKLIPQLLPTLIIAGEHDQIIPLAVYSSKKEYHRNNIFIQSIKHAGHFPWFENPEETLQVIFNFTAGLN